MARIPWERKIQIVQEAYSILRNVKPTARKFKVQPQHIRRWKHQIETRDILGRPVSSAPRKSSSSLSRSRRSVAATTKTTLVANIPGLSMGGASSITTTESPHLPMYELAQPAFTQHSLLSGQAFLPSQFNPVTLNIAIPSPELSPIHTPMSLIGDASQEFFHPQAHHPASREQSRFLPAWSPSSVGSVPAFITNPAASVLSSIPQPGTTPVVPYHAMPFARATSVSYVSSPSFQLTLPIDDPQGFDSSVPSLGPGYDQMSPYDPIQTFPSPAASRELYDQPPALMPLNNHVICRGPIPSRFYTAALQAQSSQDYRMMPQYPNASVSPTIQYAPAGGYPAELHDDGVSTFRPSQ
ncbi:uncharacterized protein BJ171DRAFT_582495 [Polychytrium aggregatum]|uniref:uncharacterized protein n=1 Tax=Polychytrium aggregatum TaxID=110093 RepID=UPI0022FE87CC|nr:uncharacterized protein BJ171DRAFT_582495 [Polychytrium aggregatum]KAI9204119.1 hypothetical protein BJ171DRAFT_582495 [Polychytrium aggregatum]